MARKQVLVGGIRLDDLDYDETLATITGLIERRELGRMVVTNASKTVLAQGDAELMRIIGESQLVTADGMSVVWASRLLGAPLRMRVTGIDTMERLVALASEKGFGVYFLGATQEVVSELVARYLERYPSLRIVGYRDGYFEDGASVAQAIKQAQPEILFVAMGSPAQEKWIATHQPEAGVPFCLGVGGSFDHIVGLRKRAPLWMQNCGLEWFYRLCSEPGRLWKRYLIGNTRFMWLVLKQRVAGQR